jgi:hypothetical protein
MFLALRLGSWGGHEDLALMIPEEDRSDMNGAVLVDGSEPRELRLFEVQNFVVGPGAARGQNPATDPR